MFNEVYKELTSVIKEKWFSPIGIISLLVLELLLLMPYFWNNFSDGISTIEGVILGFIVLISILIWFLFRRYPKNITNKIGIVIAIKTENKQEYIKLRSDLILEFKNILQHYGKENVFNIIELPEYYTKKINDRTSSIEALKRTRSHFIIYGVCKRRMEEGKENYFISTEARVVHKPIPIIVSEKLSREFAELFPRKVIFPVADEISGFEITSEWMAFVTKYIIGIAAFLSGCFDFSFDIFRKLHGELKSIAVSTPQIKKLKTRIPKRISESALALASRTYFMYRKTKDKKLLEKLKLFLDILSSIDPNNYSAHLLRGIYFFLVEKDVQKAKREIKKSRNALDVTWRYSEAFLFAYEGNLNKTEKSYKKAFKAEVSPDVIFQTEEFIYDVLEIEPEKCQLWYCVGMINWKAKGDKILAKKYFEKFLECGDNNSFMEQKSKVKEYLKQL